ncbi:hypothetical protein SCALM49S_04525 [Streptomyces californicus]
MPRVDIHPAHRDSSAIWRADHDGVAVGPDTDEVRLGGVGGPDDVDQLSGALARRVPVRRLLLQLRRLRRRGLRGRRDRGPPLRGPAEDRAEGALGVDQKAGPIEGVTDGARDVAVAGEQLTDHRDGLGEVSVHAATARRRRIVARPRCVSCLMPPSLLVHRRGGLPERQLPEVAELDRAVLVGGECQEGGVQGVGGLDGGELAQPLVLRAVDQDVAVERDGDDDLQPGPCGLEVVDDQVAGDGDEPGAEVAALPGERVDPAQRTEERLTYQVLDEMHVTDAAPDVPGHLGVVLVVEGGECLPVAAAGEDEELRLPSRSRRGDLGASLWFHGLPPVLWCGGGSGVVRYLAVRATPRSVRRRPGCAGRASRRGPPSGRSADCGRRSAGPATYGRPPSPP